MLVATAGGLLLGRGISRRAEERGDADSLREPFGVLQGALIGAAVATAALALHLAMFGRGVLTVLIASLLVTVLLVVTFDLDRPTRGLIRVPATPLVDVRTSMIGPPAAAAPTGR